MQMDFRKGHRVVHPAHGAGTITDIRDIGIGEMQCTYLVIETSEKELMVPEGQAKAVGLRPVASPERASELLALCEQPPTEQEIIGVLRRSLSGPGAFYAKSAELVARTLRVLRTLSVTRTLGAGNRRLYKRSIELLANELALASGQDLQEARVDIELRLANMASQFRSALGHHRLSQAAATSY